MSDDAIPFGGFSRVVVNHDGEGWSPARAFAIGIAPDIGFRRKDGWCLGAPWNLEHVAYRMWADEWTHFAKHGDTHWRPISEYP